MQWIGNEFIILSHTYCMLQVTKEKAGERERIWIQCVQAGRGRRYRNAVNSFVGGLRKVRIERLTGRGEKERRCCSSKSVLSLSTLRIVLHHSSAVNLFLSNMFISESRYGNQFCHPGEFLDRSIPPLGSLQVGRPVNSSPALFPVCFSQCELGVLLLSTKSILTNTHPLSEEWAGSTALYIQLFFLYFSQGLIA